MKCKRDHRIVHETCVKKLGLDAKALRCDRITEQLVPIKRGSGEVRWKTNMTAKSEHAHCMCLVCGEKLGVYDARRGVMQTDYAENTTACHYSADNERPCKFRVHAACWGVHCDINEEEAGEFKCDRVIYQLKSDTVTQ